MFADLATSARHRALVVGHGYFTRTMLAACVLGLPPGAARILLVRNCRPALDELTSPPLLVRPNLEGAEELDVPATAGQGSG